MKATPAKARLNYSPQKEVKLLGLPVCFLPEIFLLAIMFCAVVVFVWKTNYCCAMRVRP